MAKRIFVVDDEQPLADVLVAILRNTGYSAWAFYNAQSALQQVALCCPDLVISDVDMPEMSGIEMAVFIREHHPTCKILLISGAATSVSVLAEAHALQDVELLPKPIRPRDLLAKIAAADNADGPGLDR